MPSLTDTTTMPLCRVDDLSDPGSAGFVIEHNGQRTGLIIVRFDGQVHGYINSCPHIGVPLDLEPGQFLDVEQRFILCSNHGALFRIEDGLCLAGPCTGKSLEVVQLTLTNGWVLPPIA